MVPVPDEHVEAVMQFILRSIAQASIEDWDASSLTDLWNEVDEATRSLLSFTARAAAAGEELDSTDAARQMQLTPREALAIVNELIILSRNANRPSLVVPRATVERRANGRTVERRVFSMTPEVADLVREVERAELHDATLPGTPE
jgi:hypothetical protein